MEVGKAGHEKGLFVDHQQLWSSIDRPPRRHMVFLKQKFCLPAIPPQPRLKVVVLMRGGKAFAANIFLLGTFATDANCHAKAPRIRGKGKGRVG